MKKTHFLPQNLVLMRIATREKKSLSHTKIDKTLGVPSLTITY